MAGVMLRYTGTFLRRLRPFYRPKVSAPVYESLKALNIFKPYRLNRGGKGKFRDVATGGGVGGVTPPQLAQAEKIR
jgi:hypothetical protein